MFSSSTSFGAEADFDMKQVTYRKQSETKNSTAEIKIVCGAVLEPPMHPGEHVTRISDLNPPSPRVREPTLPPQPLPIPHPGGGLDRQG